MAWISFHPGPSYLHAFLKEAWLKGWDKGLYYIPHRGAAFHELYKKLYRLFQRKLGLPKGFALYFISSATEGWHIVARDLGAEGSLHWNVGSFSKRWYTYARQWHEATLLPFSLKQLPAIDPKWEQGLFCLVYVETSTGFSIPVSYLVELRRRFPKRWIAIDATSALGGIQLPWHLADIWFASVQKCLGLPPGMAVMVVHPRLIKFIEKLPEQHYNSLSRLHKNFLRWEPTHTPPLMHYFLLYSVLMRIPGIKVFHRRLLYRKRWLWGYLSRYCEPLVPYKLHAITVQVWQMEAERLRALRGFCKRHQLFLGLGHGAFSRDTFRIANFPAIPWWHYKKLLRCMDAFFNFAV